MPTRIDLTRLRELLGGGAQLVEVLPPAEYTDEHLPGPASGRCSVTTTPIP